MQLQGEYKHTESAVVVTNTGTPLIPLEMQDNAAAAARCMEYRVGWDQGSHIPAIPLHDVVSTRDLQQAGRIGTLWGQKCYWLSVWSLPQLKNLNSLTTTRYTWQSWRKLGKCDTQRRRVEGAVCKHYMRMCCN